MTFPVVFNVFGLQLQSHPVMEVIGYTGGSQLYFFLRRRSKRQTPMPIESNLWLLVGCIFGALFGAKILAVAESWSEYRLAASGGNWPALLAGKTIVGGLLGGWIGIEIAKRIVGVRRSTGDLFVFPLVFGIATGRIGCFLTGLADHTHGIPTSLPWAVDFGDGIPRHPTQLYEIAWLLTLGLILALLQKKSWMSEPGRLFRAFMIGYLGFRFVIEFIKPSDKPVFGLSMIQLASLIGVGVCCVQLWANRRGAAVQEPATLVA